MRKLPPAERARRSRASKSRWRRQNPEACNAQAKKWKAENSGKVRASQKRHRGTCRKHRTEVQRKWRKKNKRRLNARQRERLIIDPVFRLRHALGCRISKAVRRKSDHTIALIGCDVSFLMGYLEARFRPGMSWKNYGSVWEVDHRIPCASYDLRDASHQRSCFHYTNLQPMFCPDNKRKSDTLPQSHQAEML